MVGDQTLGAKQGNVPFKKEARWYGLAALLDGDMLRTQLAVLRRFLKRDPADTVTMRQRVSAAVLAGDRYPFEGR